MDNKKLLEPLIKTREQVLVKEKEKATCVIEATVDNNITILVRETTLGKQFWRRILAIIKYLRFVCLLFSMTPCIDGGLM